MRRTILILRCLSLGAMLAATGLAQQEPATVTREYYTPFGTLVLTVKDSQAHGVYSHENGELNGRLEGHELTGSWRQNDGSGSIVMTFSEDFATFKARYNRVNTPDKWETDWTGMRKPDLQVRKYKTPWGLLVLNIEGTQLSGSYPWFNGKIMGELKGREFTGIWLQSNGGVGTLNLAFAEDFSAFRGRYNDYNYHPDKWGEWNGTLTP